jgi:hypothetical protein
MPNPNPRLISFGFSSLRIGGWGRGLFFGGGGGLCVMGFMGVSITGGGSERKPFRKNRSLILPVRNLVNIKRGRGVPPCQRVPYMSKHLFGHNAKSMQFMTQPLLTTKYVVLA